MNANKGKAPFCRLGCVYPLLYLNRHMHTAKGRVWLCWFFVAAISALLGLVLLLSSTQIDIEFSGTRTFFYNVTSLEDFKPQWPTVLVCAMQNGRLIGSSLVNVSCSGHGNWNKRVAMHNGCMQLFNDKEAGGVPAYSLSASATCALDVVGVPAQTDYVFTARFRSRKFSDDEASEDVLRSPCVSCRPVRPVAVVKGGGFATAATIQPVLYDFDDVGNYDLEHELAYDSTSYAWPASPTEIAQGGGGAGSSLLYISWRDESLVVYAPPLGVALWSFLASFGGLVFLCVAALSIGSRLTYVCIYGEDALEGDEFDTQETAGLLSGARFRNGDGGLQNTQANENEAL